MTTYHGNSGVIKVGANAVAEVKDFSVTEEFSPTDDTSMGDTAVTSIAGAPTKWSGSINCHYYPADTNGQGALTVGASVSLELDCVGDTSGLEKMSGTAWVTKRSVSADKGSVVSVSFDFEGNGALTHGSISS